MMPTFLKIIFPPPSMFVNVMSAANILIMGNLGWSEMRGKHMQYSKFWNVLDNGGQNAISKSQGAASTTKPYNLSSRSGMLLIYTPAFLAAVAFFWVFPDEGLRFLLVRSALTIHFFKRLLEVLYIHKYSGGVSVPTALTISTCYFASTSTIVFVQHLTQGLPEPAFDLKYPGLLLFLIGIIGNLYHHYLLSTLRGNDNDKGYRVPKGGLFSLVICPHYLFEMFIYWGIFFISQTLYSFSAAVGTLFYLMGRSFATRRWYLSKFDDVSREIKAIIPFFV